MTLKQSDMHTSREDKHVSLLARRQAHTKVDKHASSQSRKLTIKYTCTQTHEYKLQLGIGYFMMAVCWHGWNKTRKRIHCLRTCCTTPWQTTPGIKFLEVFCFVSLKSEVTSFYSIDHRTFIRFHCGCQRRSAKKSQQMGVKITTK